MDLGALVGIAKVAGAIVGQIAHVVKDTRKIIKGERAGGKEVTDGEALRRVVVDRPFNTLTAIGTALGSVLALLPDTGNPVTDFINAFLMGYGADSMVNRAGNPK